MQFEFKGSHLLLSFTLIALFSSTHAAIMFDEGVQVLRFTSATTTIVTREGPFTEPVNYQVTPVSLVRFWGNPTPDVHLTVDGGSVLGSGFGIYTNLPLGFTDLMMTDDMPRHDIFVKDPGSRIEIGTNDFRGGDGNLILRGRSQLSITNGAQMIWTGVDACNTQLTRCDVLIGARPASNSLVLVDGPGSLLDASNTRGRFWIGVVPGLINPNTNSDDGLVILNGGEVRSNEGHVAKGFESSPTASAWDGVSQVQGHALIAGGSWTMDEKVSSLPGDNPTNLEIGFGDGASGVVVIADGGVVNVGSPGEFADFSLGFAEGGVTSAGGTNLLIIDGSTSVLNVDDNSSEQGFGESGQSAIGNGFVNLQNGATLNLDSSLLLITGNQGVALSNYLVDHASNVNAFAASVEYAGTPFILAPTAINLDVRSGSSVNFTDNDVIGKSALIIGQTPNQVAANASVRVTGPGSNITVVNDSSQAKLPLNTQTIGVPGLSNVGRGSLSIEDSGTVSIMNGDFVVAAQTGDAASLLVTDGTFIADRIVVGWSDFEGGTVAPGASTGQLVLSNGTVNSDVIVDDNGILAGIGTINGTLFVEGGVVAPGFSPGTISVASLVMGLGSELILEVGIGADGKIDPAASDIIIAMSGDLDLSAGNVTFELYDVDETDDTSLADLLGMEQVLAVGDLLDASGVVSIESFSVTAEGFGEGEAEELARVYTATTEIAKDDCKQGGWQDLGSAFKNQGDCIQFVNTGK